VVSQKGRIPDIRRVLAAFNSNSKISTHQVTYLAEWLYRKGRFENIVASYTAIRKDSYTRPKDTHLIGKNLMFALCHADI